MRRAWILLLGVVLSGCARLPMHRQYAGPQPVPPDVSAYYSYQAKPPADVSMELVEEKPGYRRWIVRFPLIAEGFEPTEPTIEFEWLESTQPGRRAAILFSPILGGDYPLERGIARFFARQGFHTALVHRKTLKISPEHDASHLERLMRQAIVRNRQIVDWMAANERVDPVRLGSFGISMGGIANVITAAVEPRLRANVIVLAGGSLADILHDSRDKLLTKPRAKYLAKHGLTVDEMHELLSQTVKTDPLRFAPHMDASRSLWFIALLDRTVGRENELKLWRAAGRPEAFFWPAGHYTSLLYLPYLKYRSLVFFKKRLH